MKIYTDDSYTPFTGTYADLVNEVLEYVTAEKKNHSELSIVDLVYSYCVKKNYNPEMVGDAIRDDYQFTILIQNELTALNNNEDEW